MPSRYCGRLRINVTLTPQDTYNCVISKARPGGFTHLKTVGVRHPVYLERSIDHPLSYDRAAHAALSFATSADLEEDETGDEMDIIHEIISLSHPDPNGGWSIRRKP